MRDLKVGVRGRESMVPKDVDVNGPGAPPDQPLAAQRRFYPLDLRQQSARRKAGAQFHHLVEVVGLFEAHPPAP